MKYIRRFVVVILFFSLLSACSSQDDINSPNKENEHTLNAENVYNGFVVQEKGENNLFFGTLIIKNEDNWNEFSNKFIGKNFMGKVLEKYDLPFYNFDDKAVVYYGGRGSANSEKIVSGSSEVDIKIDEMNQKKYIAYIGSGEQLSVYNDTSQNDLSLFYVNISLVDKTKLPEELLNEYENQRNLGNIDKGGNSFN